MKKPFWSCCGGLVVSGRVRLRKIDGYRQLWKVINTRLRERKTKMDARSDPQNFDARVDTTSEGDKIAERFMRTLMEQVLRCHGFKNIKEAPRIIGEFIEPDNRPSLIEHLVYLKSSAARRRFAESDSRAV